VASQGTERRLAAIMFTDIVGYTGLMAESEETGLRVRERHRQVARPLVERYGGRWVEETGDESLSSFPSAVDAVNCALAVQAELRNDPSLRLRIGIHLGETLVAGGRIYGDGVNVASRIRPLAEPGGICISDEVQHSVQNQPNLDTRSLGQRDLKNVVRPVEVFAVSGEPSPPGPRPRRARSIPTGVALAILGGVMLLLGLVWWRGAFLGAPPQGLVPGFSAPAIVVLPFDNLSGEPQQDLFAAGLAEDLTMRLASWRRFPVIARRSVFEVARLHESHSLDLEQAARELGARYVVVGSIRRGGDRVRVTVQLIDASSDHHIWAQQYDRGFNDILALQDEISTSIVGAMHPSLLQVESARAMRRARAPCARIQTTWMHGATPSAAGGTSTRRRRRTTRRREPTSSARSSWILSGAGRMPVSPWHTSRMPPTCGPTRPSNPSPRS
jgi:adenylate cyclase